MDILDKVFTREELITEPPILLDIGASGEINPKWKQIAKYSICIAFDADDREMNYVIKESSGYRKLYVYNCIVTDKNSQELDFYLTKSPYCSSLLQPDSQSLQDFAFADLFKVESKIKIKAKEIKSVLDELGINRVDWFKTDSQGTDLRLFINLGKEIISKVLVAEFEPGILDSYQGEDKLYSIINYLEDNQFWMSDITIKGSQRIKINNITRYFNKFEQKYLDKLHKTTPGWAEVTYFSKCQQSLSKRDLLLAWVFAIIEQQYGFALEIAQKGQESYADPFFEELIKQTLRKFKTSYWSNLPFLVVKKITRKLLRIIPK